MQVYAGKATIDKLSDTNDMGKINAVKSSSYPAVYLWGNVSLVKGPQAERTLNDARSGDSATTLRRCGDTWNWSRLALIDWTYWTRGAACTVDVAGDGAKSSARIQLQRAIGMRRRLGKFSAFEMTGQSPRMHLLTWDAEIATARTSNYRR